MDGFGDNFDDNDVDPAAEFIAREQNQLAGLEDEVQPAVASLNPLSNEPVPPVVLNGHAEDEELFSQPPTPAKTPPIREEPEKIKKWREEQKKRLEDKDAEEEKKKEEMRNAAKKELEEWYQHHEELIAKTKAANRNAEKQFVAEVDDIEPGTEWERIAKLCDFNPKVGRTNKDVSRMRSIILQLKQTPLKTN